MVSISVSPEVYDLLRSRARQIRVSPEVLADDALRSYLKLTEPTWQQSFAALLARVQSNSSQYQSEEIEADISAAALETKEARRARRSAA